MKNYNELKEEIVKIIKDEIYFNCDFDREMDEEEFIKTIASPMVEKIIIKIKK